jgi:hypothetical protein
MLISVGYLTQKCKTNSSQNIVGKYELCITIIIVQKMINIVVFFLPQRRIEKLE